jgi:hypothetical protein
MVAANEPDDEPDIDWSVGLYADNNEGGGIDWGSGDPAGERGIAWG